MNCSRPPIVEESFPGIARGNLSCGGLPILVPFSIQIKSGSAVHWGSVYNRTGSKSLSTPNSPLLFAPVPGLDHQGVTQQPGSLPPWKRPIPNSITPVSPTRLKSGLRAIWSEASMASLWALSFVVRVCSARSPMPQRLLLSYSAGCSVSGAINSSIASCPQLT